jgi:hypothetical protein
MIAQPARAPRRTQESRYNRHEAMWAAAAVLFAFAAAVRQAPSPPAAAEPKPVFEYAGRPLPLTAVCGDDEILEFGLTCAVDEPCPVYLDLSFADMAGARLVLAGNFHTGSATLSSVLLLSEDAGKTWSEPHPRIRGALLDQVQFTDSRHGWAAGQIAGAIPRDPFFLHTADGGRTWRRLPVFDETFYGAIEHFWFENKSQGTLMLDRVRGGARAGRYMRLDTADGGDTWTARESAMKPWPGKRARGATSLNPALRLRPDAKTRSHTLELRQDGKWTTLAAFAVSAGECRPEPPKVEPEPPSAPEKKP